MRAARGRHLVVAAIATFSAVGARPVSAQPADDPPAAADSVLTAVQVLSSEYDVGDHVAVQVTIAADRLIDGHVEIRKSNGSWTVRQPVEVAGGSTEEFYLLVPSSQFDDSRLRVELFDGDRSLDLDDVNFTHDVGTDVAGVMPVLLATMGDLPERVTLSGDTRRVNVVALPVELMSAGAAALTQLDSIAASSHDLTALDARARAALLTWVADGGHLLLDDDGDLSALPAAWRPGDDGYALAGQGVVTTVDGAAAAGHLDEVLQPAALGPFDNPAGFAGTDMFIDPRVTLAERAGVDLPDLSAIVLVLGGYVVLIGPILYLVLRRARRLTAAWLAIPLVALLLAGGVAITGSSWRTGGRTTSSTVLEVHPGGSYAYADLLVFRRSDPTSKVAMPDGWVASEPGSFGFFGGGQQANRVHVVGEGDHHIETRLESGQVAVLDAEGPVASELLTLDARMSASDTVSGTVTNNGQVLLQSVAVFAGGRAELVGDLAAGASKDYTIDHLSDSPDPFGSAIGTVWPDVRFGVGTTSPAPGVDLGIWTSFAARDGDRLYPTGHVRAAGWTTELPAAVGDDDTSFDNTTLVTTVAPIGSTGRPVPATAVRRAWVESPFDPRTGEQGDPVVRFVVPPGTAADQLELELPTGIESVSVLNADGDWDELQPSPAGGTIVAVPAEAVHAGTLLVRSTLDFSKQVDITRVMPILRGTTP